MVARANEVVTMTSLNGSDAEVRLKALRCIKNQVIGNKAKKLFYIRAGVIPRVIELLTAETDAETLVQGAATVGSLACGMAEAVDQLVVQGGLLPLIQMLGSDDARVMKAAVRAIRLVVQSPQVPRTVLLQPEVLSRLVSLLGSDDAQLAESVAGVLTWGRVNAEEAELLITCGAGISLLGLLTSPCTSLQLAALDALVPLMSHVKAAAALAALVAATASGASFVRPTLLSLLRDQRPHARFKAACFITYFRCGLGHASTAAEQGSTAAMLIGTATDQGGAAPATESGAAAPVGTSAAVAGGCASQEGASVERAALLVLLRLLEVDSGSRVRECVPLVLARLLENSEELQKMAAEADAIHLLAGCLSTWANVPAASTAPIAAAAAMTTVSGLPPARQATGPDADRRPATDEMAVDCGQGTSGSGTSGGGSSGGCSSSGRQFVQEGTLRALSTLCMNRDASRKQLIEAKVLDHIVRALEDGSGGTRAAAASCVRALSRSVRTLRSTLLTSNVAAQLCLLLDDPDIDVQLNASAALCNLVLEFCAVKSAVLHNGGLRRLVRLTCSALPSLRLNAVWALRNMAYRSDAAVRAALVQELPWQHFVLLLRDTDASVREQAMCVVRNLVMDEERNITAVLEWAQREGGGGLLPLLEEVLTPDGRTPPRVQVHALFTVVNLSTGSEQHKRDIMRSGLPQLLVQYLDAQPRPCTSGSDATTDGSNASTSQPSASSLSHSATCAYGRFATAPAVDPEDAVDTHLELRIAAIWSVFNLVYQTGSSGAGGRAVRQGALRALGAGERLRAIAEDERAELDVRDRARSAMERLAAD